jgi:protein transport protein SEC24
MPCFECVDDVLTVLPGIRMASFHGNFFVRSTDLLAMPAVPQDQSYAIEIQIEETITSPVVVFQTAILHTTCYGLLPSPCFAWLSHFHCVGERRIRVITTAVPSSVSLSEIFASADQVALATLLANKAVERSITHKLEDARDAVFQKLVDILQSYKASMTAAGAGASAQLAISENLRMLPVMLLGMLKNVSLVAVNDSMLTLDVISSRLESVRARRSRPI